MVLAQTQTQLYLEDFLQLPETKHPREYIYGKTYTKPIPKGKHSAIKTFLATAINQVGISQKIVRAFTELRCTFAGRLLVPDSRFIVPDISVFAWDRIPVNQQGEIEDMFAIASYWTIEILSPEPSSTRVINKIIFGLDHGTKLGWLIHKND